MTDNHTICLENGDPLGEDLLNMTPEQLKLVEREETIPDVEFKTEAVSARMYGGVSCVAK